MKAVAQSYIEGVCWEQENKLIYLWIWKNDKKKQVLFYMNSYTISIIISCISILGIIVNVFYTASLKRKTEQKLYVHRLKFEHEFTIYKNFWSSLTKYNNSALLYIIALLKREDWISVKKALAIYEKDRQDFIEVFADGFPFIDSALTERMNELLEEMDETIKPAIKFNPDEDSYEALKEIYRKMYDPYKFNDISLIIRKNLGINN